MIVLQDNQDFVEFSAQRSEPIRKLSRTGWNQPRGARIKGGGWKRPNFDIFPFRIKFSADFNIMRNYSHQVLAGEGMLGELG